MYILDLCYDNPAYEPTLRGCSPSVLYDMIVVYYIRLKCQLSGRRCSPLVIVCDYYCDCIYISGLSANSQEMLSTAHGAITHH